MLGEKIKDYRKKTGLSQYKFADMLGISRSYVADLEKNKLTGSLKLIKTLVEKTGLDFTHWIEEDDVNEDTVQIYNSAGTTNEFIATNTMLQLIFDNHGYDTTTKKLHPKSWDSLLKVFEEEVKMKILLMEDETRDS